MKTARLALWLAVCAILGLSATVYSLRNELSAMRRANNSLRQQWGDTSWRLLTTEHDLTGVRQRLLNAEAELSHYRKGFLIPGDPSPYHHSSGFLEVNGWGFPRGTYGNGKEYQR